MIISDVINYLNDVLEGRLSGRFEKNGNTFPYLKISNNNSTLIRFIDENKLSEAETIILFIALVPHISPDFFNNVLSKYFPNGGDFPVFGGVKGKNHRGILPTGETALYVLAGNDIEKRIELSSVFDQTHFFARKNIITLETAGEGEPKMSGRLILDEEYVDWFTKGTISKPKLSSDFPAQLISTDLEWSDLVLKKQTFDEIKEIETWLSYNEKLLHNWNLKGKIKPGYRVLFYGPPGTGKTMTACLLGKYTNRDVFRIDLSMVVSKYIGETEKNLSKLFDKAENKDWILFFDEADSIFGKRTNVRDAHDKYANQEVSYLLQRIEGHSGLVILASNMKSNIDNAFVRRFNTIIEFENPGVNERLQLWENYLPKSVKTEQKILMNEIAKNYELSGANIVNVIQYVGLKTIAKNADTIRYSDLISGIQKEYKKEGKMIRRE